jgi:hypothetical protein
LKFSADISPLPSSTAPNLCINTRPRKKLAEDQLRIAENLFRNPIDRELGLAAAVAAGSVHYTPCSVVGLVFACVATLAIVVIAVFGCAGHKKNYR